MFRLKPNVSVLTGKMMTKPHVKYFCSVNKLKVPLEGHLYTDPKYYDVERKELLGKSWQFLSHESALNQNGVNAGATYLADTVSGWPVIIVKDSKSGSIKGFHNICRHRAGPLEWNGTSGVCKINGLMCKYHGWTFTMDGKLRGMPRFGDTSSVNKSDYNLWPVRVANYNGLIFVQTLPPDDGKPNFGPECDQLFLEENLKFCSRVNAIEGMKDFTVIKSATHKINCNWKVYVENYMEGYHIPFMHEGLDSQIDMDEYYVKVVKESPNNSKKLQGYVEHVVTTSPNVETAMDGLWLWHSPTLAINYYNNGMSLERIVPTSADSVEIRYQYAFKDVNDTVENQKAIDTSYEVTLEDIEICENVQLNLSGGGYKTPGLLSPRHEDGVGFFQDVVRETHGLPVVEK